MQNGSEPASKRDIQEVLQKINDSETKLLTAFYDFAKANNERIAEIEKADASLIRRLGIVEDRLLAVEKRLNLPPTA
jgi:hypothetical protein